jgi:hypothetical protein
MLATLIKGVKHFKNVADCCNLHLTAKGFAVGGRLEPFASRFSINFTFGCRDPNRLVKNWKFFWFCLLIKWPHSSELIFFSLLPSDFRKLDKLRAASFINGSQFSAAYVPPETKHDSKHPTARCLMRSSPAFILFDNLNKSISSLVETS